MTYFYNTLKQATHQEIIFAFKETLKLAGWSITSSGTGTSGTYNSTGDNIVTATNLGVRSWFVAAHPTLDGYQRYLCFQMDVSAGIGGARIKMAWAPYSAGSPNANTVPGSADEQVLLGSGTDASPTTASFLSSSVPLNNVFISCGNAAEKYNFYLLSHQTIAAPTLDYVVTVFLMQYLNNANALDIDPYVYHALNSPNFSASSNAFGSNGSSPLKGWFKKGLVGAAFTTYPVVFYGGDLAAHMLSDIGTNPFDGSVPLFPLIVARSNTTNNGIKGIVRDMSISLTPRGNLTTLSVGSARDKIFFGRNYVINHNGAKVSI